MPLNLRGTAAAILSVVTVSGAETALSKREGPDGRGQAVGEAACM